MKLKISYHTTQGEAHLVTTNLGTIVAWERKFKRKAVDMAQGIGVEDLAFLAYEASRQNGITVPPTLDDFIAKVDDIALTDETENPTQPAQLADS
jgi:hypothetical protein